MREDGLPVDWSVPAPSVPVITDDYQPADAHEGEQDDGNEVLKSGSELRKAD